MAEILQSSSIFGGSKGELQIVLRTDSSFFNSMCEIVSLALLFREKNFFCFEI